MPKTITGSTLTFTFTERMGVINRSRQMVIHTDGTVELDGKQTRGRMSLGAAFLAFAREWRLGRASVEQESLR